MFPGHFPEAKNVMTEWSAAAAALVFAALLHKAQRSYYASQEKKVKAKTA
jgi:hypothetical protein